jgi:peptidoglycan-associated lipoprotein
MALTHLGARYCLNEGEIMMNKRIISGPIATTLVLTSLLLGACAKKPPAELPPAPVDTSNSTTGTGGDAGSGNVNQVALPGSRGDFLSKVTADRVFFATDVSDLDAAARATLDSQARWLTQYPNVHVTIEGHCDERGTREYNLALGDRRANSAKNYLISLGINPARITTISYGKERPEALGSDEESWAKNRRAVTVVPQ